MSAAAQTGLPDPAWEFSSTLKSATDVLVGDIVAGTATDGGNNVSVKATVRVVRVLQGSIAPGAELSLDWQYRPAPSQPPSVTTKVPSVRALWFLRSGAGGRKETLRAAYFMTQGGVYLPAAEVSRPCGFDAPLTVKVACEIGAALEEMALRYAVDLAPRPMPPPNSGVLPEWALTRTRFQALAAGLHALDRTATAGIYARLSSLSDPNLKAVGLQGRYNCGDDGALFDLERSLATAAPVFNIGGLPLNLRWTPDLAVAHALGRMAVAETPLWEIERHAPGALQATRRPEVLPYLVTMLGSPEQGTRESAVMSLCHLLRGGGLWLPEMDRHCPTSSIADDPEEERRNLRFWNEWWANHRDAIAKTVVLPHVTRPARYDASPFQEAPKPRVTIEPSFMNHGLAHRFYSSRSGPRPPDILAALLEGNDLAVWRQALTAAGLKMDALTIRAQEIRNAARVAGAPPDPERYRALQEEETAWARQALSDLRRGLTLSGWQIVEQFLTDPNSLTAPVPGK